MLLKQASLKILTEASPMQEVDGKQKSRIRGSSRISQAGTVTAACEHLGKPVGLLLCQHIAAASKMAASSRTWLVAERPP